MNDAQQALREREKDPQQLFSVGDVARLFEMQESKLRYWSQTGFIQPSVRQAGRAFYRFRDLVSIKVAKGLLDAGLPLQRVRRSLDALRMSLPQDPLATMRVRCDHDQVLVEDGEQVYEAATGQLLLDFDVATLQAQVADVVALPWVAATQHQRDEATAYGWFLRAREHERAFEPHEAVACYRRALERDPEFASAWTNLGSLLAEAAELDSARDAFDQALSIDPEQTEAQTNLAELALRQGDVEVAIAGFRAALRSAPDYAEAHYGLARALLRVGGQAQALAHLERFRDALSATPVAKSDQELAHRLERVAEAIQRLRRELSART